MQQYICPPPRYATYLFFSVYLRVFGGEPAPASTLAPKVGPHGLSPKKIGDDIAKATKEYLGLRVTCKLTVQNRQAQVEVVPSASTLVIKALKEPVRDRKKEKDIKHDGDLTFEQLLDISRIMRVRSNAKTLAGTMMEILGTCYSVGCTIDGEHPGDLQKRIRSGDVEVPEE